MLGSVQNDDALSQELECINNEVVKVRPTEGMKNPAHLEEGFLSLGNISVNLLGCFYGLLLCQILFCTVRMSKAQFLSFFQE